MSLATAESHPLQQQRAALQAMMASLGEISPPQLELLELRSPLGHKILACVNYGVDTDLLSAAHGLMTEVFGGLPTQPWLQELDDMSDMKAKSQLDPSSAVQLSAHLGKRSDGWQPMHPCTRHGSAFTISAQPACMLCLQTQPSNVGASTPTARTGSAFLGSVGPPRSTQTVFHARAAIWVGHGTCYVRLSPHQLRHLRLTFLRLLRLAFLRLLYVVVG